MNVPKMIFLGLIPVALSGGCVLLAAQEPPYHTVTAKLAPRRNAWIWRQVSD